MSDSPDETTPKYVPPAGGADPFATRLTAELPHDRGILVARYDPSNRFLFAGARDTLLHRWDLSIEPAVEPPADPKKKPKTPPVPQAPESARLKVEGHESWIAGITFSPDGKRCATGDFVGRVIVWTDLDTTPRQKFAFEAHEGAIRQVAFSPDGRLLASGGNDNMVRLWDLSAAGKLHRELTGHDCHVYQVAFHPVDGSLISADLKCRIFHWTVETGEQIREIDASALHTWSEKYEVDVGGVRGLQFDAGGTRLACAGAVGDKGIAHSGNARVLLFDWESGTLQRTLRPEKDEISTAWGVRFHPDGFLVASGGSRTGGFLWFWTPGDDVAFHMVKFQQRAPGFDVDLSADGKTLAVANHDGHIRLWSLAPEPAAAEPAT